MKDIENKDQEVVEATTNAAVSHNGHKYVDLGLPSGLLWATCNVGANSPEEYGDYFAWGETEPKQEYNWDTYKFNQEEGFSKYDADEKEELDLEDDAAYVNWGGNWRMPTREEMDELQEYCEWIWSHSNKGYIVKSKVNGFAIFLPATGYRDDFIFYNGTVGYAWSRSLNEFNARSARNIRFSSDEVKAGRSFRSDGQSVRPVCPRQ